MPPDFGDPGPTPVLDYQGQPDDRTWIMREKVLEDDAAHLRAEVVFLREMLRLALAHNTGTERDCSTRQA